MGGFRWLSIISRWKKNLNVINVVNKPSSNLRHVSQYPRSKEKFEMHVHIVNVINFQAWNLGYGIQCFVSWQRLWQVQQGKGLQSFLKRVQTASGTPCCLYRFLNTDTKDDNKEPCSCKIWQHGQKKVKEHYATCIDHWDTHMDDYMNSDFKEQFWVSYFQDQVHIMEMKETMKKRSKVKKFQVWKCTTPAELCHHLPSGKNRFWI
jgi:hypothetical protein